MYWNLFYKKFSVLIVCILLLTVYDFIVFGNLQLQDIAILQIQLFQDPFWNHNLPSIKDGRSRVKGLLCNIWDQAISIEL